MRWLFLFSAGFAAVCACGVYDLPHFGALLVGMLLAAWIARKNRRLVLGILAAALGFVAGWGRCVYFEKQELGPLWEMEGQTVYAFLTVYDSREGETGTAAECEVRIGEKWFRAWVYLGKGETVRPGDGLQGLFRLNMTDSGSSLQGRGVFVTLRRIGQLTQWEGAPKSFRIQTALWRCRVKEVLSEAIPEDARGIAEGIFLGDADSLDYETDTALRVCGMRHTVAVSGMHFSILFALLFGLLGKRIYLTTLIVAPILLVYGTIVGMTVSVVRALVMMLIMVGSLVIKREYDSLTALGTAACVILWSNPYAVCSVAFQLSFFGVLGIIFFGDPLSKRIEGFGKEKGVAPSGFLNGLSATAGAMIMTIPISAWRFGCVSLIGLLINPLLGILITGIFVATLLCALTGLCFLPAGKVLGWMCGWLIRGLKAAVMAVSRLPLAAVYTKSIFVVIALAFCYLLLALGILKKGKNACRLGWIAAAGLCTAVGISWLLPLTANAQVSILDVGQGQCVILQSGRSVYVVDCGGGIPGRTADLVAETLLSRGIARVDGLIISHLDADHSDAAGNLLTRIRADAVFLPDYGDTDTFIRGISGHAGAVFLADRDYEITSGGMRIRIFARKRPLSSNESSLCVLFQTEKCAILITGDQTVAGEEKLLARENLPRLTALVVGHHGAETSTSEKLLSELKPEMAIISVGKNSYGHPAEKVLDRLKRAGCVIYRTDEMGTVEIRR